MDGLRRGSMRLGLKRSLENTTPDYTCAMFAQEIDHVDSDQHLEQLQRAAEGSVERLRKKQRRSGAAKREAVKAPVPGTKKQEKAVRAIVVHEDAVSGRRSTSPRVVRNSSSVAKVRSDRWQTGTFKQCGGAASSLPTPSPDLQRKPRIRIRFASTWTRAGSLVC